MCWVSQFPFPRGGYALCGGQGQILFLLARLFLPAAAALTLPAAAGRGSTLLWSPSPRGEGGGSAKAHRAVVCLGFPSCLDFARRWFVTRDNVVGEPELVHIVEGEVLFNFVKDE